MKEIEFTIKPDGTVDMEQTGFEGKECTKTAEELIKILGTDVKNVKKPEWFKTQKVKIHQQTR